MRGRMSVGRIVLFCLIVSAFFVVVYHALAFMVESMSAALRIVGDSTGEPRIMGTLYSIATTVFDWLRRVIVSPMGLAVVLLITMIYAVVTEE